MASRHSIARPLGSALRAAKTGSVARNATRGFATTVTRPKELAADVSDLPNLRHAQRGPQGTIHAPVVNITDKFQERADELHKYGQYLLSCMPKYIQQYAIPPGQWTEYPSYRHGEHMLTPTVDSASGRMS